jgi:hypothetical protein
MPAPARRHLVLYSVAAQRIGRLPIAGRSGETAGLLAHPFKRLWPSGERRQRHQDRLDIAAGLEPELGAAVVEQVEFDIAAAADELMAPLFVGP